ncbi:MAG: hypothetical protein JO144_08880, partial [Actinobacteria bacterium]|nr:hypothetical protein [Actinomycetota bacterium]
MPTAHPLPFRFPLVTGAVSIAVSGLLLTGCGGRPQPTTLDGLARGSTGIQVGGIGGVAVDPAPGGTAAAASSGMAAAAPGGMAAGIAVPVNAVTPVAATPAASVDGHLLA